MRSSAGMYFDGLTRNVSKGSSFNAGNQRLPRISSVLPTLSEPCSPTCYSLTSNEATLRAGFSSMRLEGRGWSESDKQQLIDILSAYDGSGLERICELKAVFSRTCAEVGVSNMSIFFCVAKQILDRATNYHHFTRSIKRAKRA